MNNLLKEINSDVLLKTGFTYKPDPTGDGRGDMYLMMNDKFILQIDAWAEVTLYRRNPDSDGIVLKCDTLSDLREVIHFIED